VQASKDRVSGRGACVAALYLILLICAGRGVHAQSLEPRAFANTPVGMNFFLAGYAYSQGAIAVDPSIDIEDANITTNTGLVSYVRSLGVLGNSAKFAVLVPYVFLEGSGRVEGELRERKVDGLADPLIRLSYNFIGAPALTLEEYGSYRQDTIVGANLFVTLPVGQYDPDRLVNIGSNRWSFRPQVGVSKALGPWTLEGSLEATFYTDNTNFFSGNTRTQDPVYGGQAHVIRQFKRGFWGSVDAAYYTGGRSSLNGVENDDFQENWRFGATLALPVSLRNSIKLFGSTGLFARTGTDFDTVGVVWQHRWGGGI